MVTDPISDLLTRIRNAQLVEKRTVNVPVSKMAKAILDVLKAEGFVESYGAVKPEKVGPEKVGSEKGKGFEMYGITLKYFNDGDPVIRRLDRVSKPGRRVYSKMEDLPKVQCGLGVSIVSTSQGVLSDREARKRKLGGEVLAVVS